MPSHLLTFVALPQQNGVPFPWLFFVMTALILVGSLGLAIFLLRRTLGRSSGSELAGHDPVPRAENVPAFMTASMQAVILRLLEQEKELEPLHKAERERAENTARLSEEVTRNMPAGLIVSGANGLISGTNPAAEQALGIKGLVFRRYSEALGESSTLSSLIRRCLAEGKIFRREQAAHIAPDGTHRQLGVTISPIRRGEQKATGAICLLSDLTELASLQKQMQLRENLAALGELSAGIAHEFKNALATISGYAQMIQSEPNAAEALDYAKRILEQTRNIAHVVTEFLKYARPLEIPDERVPLQTTVERVVSEVREALPQVTIRWEGAFGDAGGDEGLLRQALLNLARNAAEACALTAGGGRVVVRGDIVDGEETGFQRISVTDNGPGIPVDSFSKLFRPFFTTKAKGTGLGLAVVQKIIVQHGGQVEVRNRAEGGAEFIVTLPLPRSATEAVESKQASI